MNEFKLAIVQHRSTPMQIEQNTQTAIKYIKEASQGGADFIMFPECFLTGYYCPEIYKSLKPVSEIENEPQFIDWCSNALADNDRHIVNIKEAAKKYNIGVLITAYTKGKKRPQNSAFIIDRKGNVLLKYSKVHTCDFDWEQYLESGDEFKVCNFEGLNIGVMICYDREHPESARELMLEGAEIILVPNDCDCMRPRLMELAVEAMQNMVLVAMANPPGEKAGSSCAYHPIVWDDNGEKDTAVVVADPLYVGITYAQFDIAALRDYRDSEFLGKNRKPKAYRHLAK